MSHYTTVSTQFADRNYLVKALVASGFRLEDIEVYDVAQNLYGYEDDKRAEKANVIIRRHHVGGSANDLGFVKTPDGYYRAIVSEFDSNHGGYNRLASETKGYNDRFMGRLLGQYALIAAKTELEKQGCEVEIINEGTDSARVVGKRQTIGGRLAKFGKIVKKQVVSLRAS